MRALALKKSSLFILSCSPIKIVNSATRACSAVNCASSSFGGCGVGAGMGVGVGGFSGAGREGRDGGAVGAVGAVVARTVGGIQKNAIADRR